jgi:chloramphenicol 3-O-phosphotransferase
MLGVLRESGARAFFVGVFCSVTELERRESSRAGGEVRPCGLARRSDELCHSHDLDYDVTVRTDEQSTAESVEAIVATMRDAGLLP